MFFKKKILIASIYFNSNKTFLTTYSKDTKGLSYMSNVKFLSDENLSNNLGEECLMGLEEFKEGVSPPVNVSIEIKPLLKKMGCQSWNSLFDKYNSIGFEGVRGKYVIIQPSTKMTKDRSKFYATNQEKVVKVDWDANIVGDKLSALIQKY